MKAYRDNCFTHACKMVKKTYKNYLLLSVTIFISFSIMLAYLVFTDSNIHNKYDELMGASPNVFLSTNSYDENIVDMNNLINELEKLKDTRYYMVGETTGMTSYGNQCAVDIMPTYTWAIFDYANLDGFIGPRRIQMNGKWGFSLGSDEVIIPRSMDDGTGNLDLVLTRENGEKTLKKYKVVGIYDDNDHDLSETQVIYISAASIGGENIDKSNCMIVIYAEYPEYVIQLLNHLDLTCVNVIEDQVNAIKEKNELIKGKYIIAVVLFILLGINLYSSFANTLNDRKFEIGVKRAIGAGKKDIMIQFVVEGIVVMLINIMMSVILIMNVTVVYKYIQMKLHDIRYTVIMSRESVILFTIFAFFLTLTFSLLFAYKSTKVEIIKYLKEE